MPQNWWDLFPEVIPSPADRPRPLPGLDGMMPGSGVGIPLLPTATVGATPPSAFAGGFGSDKLLDRAPLKAPFSADQGMLAAGRTAAVQLATDAIQNGADPKAVRARLNGVGMDGAAFDPSDPFSDLIPGDRQMPGAMRPPEAQQAMIPAGQTPPARDFLAGRYDSYGPVPMPIPLGASNSKAPLGFARPDRAGPGARFYPAAYAQDHLDTRQNWSAARELAPGGGDPQDGIQMPTGHASRSAQDSLPQPPDHAAVVPNDHPLTYPSRMEGDDIVVTGPPRVARDAMRQGASLIRLTPDDILNIKKVLQTEWVQRAGTDQARGIIDTILNRLASGHWGSTISGVVNRRSQFSAINGRPAWREGRHSVEEYPISRVSRVVNDFVDAYLAERANGAQSIVGTNLNYANPVPGHGTDPQNLPWVRRLDGPILGSRGAIHRHGTTPENQRYRPGPYSIILPRLASAPPGQ